MRLFGIDVLRREIPAASSVEQGILSGWSCSECELWRGPRLGEDELVSAQVFGPRVDADFLAKGAGARVSPLSRGSGRRRRRFCPSPLFGLTGNFCTGIGRRRLPNTTGATRRASSRLRRALPASSLPDRHASQTAAWERLLVEGLSPPADVGVRGFPFSPSGCLARRRFIGRISPQPLAFGSAPRASFPRRRPPRASSASALAVLFLRPQGRRLWGGRRKVGGCLLAE